MRRSICLIMAVAILLAGCKGENEETVNREPAPESIPVTSATNAVPTAALKWDIDPETFSVTLKGDDSVIASAAGEKSRAENIDDNSDGIAWVYPEQQLAVKITQMQDYLNVSILYTGDESTEASATWPYVSGDDYTLPLGEGKRFASDDPVWADYLGNDAWDMNESFSMSFAAAGFGDKAVVYVFPDNFNNEMAFDDGSFSIQHTYTTLAKSKDYTVRVYVTENDPFSIAQAYKGFVQETTGIRTLQDKAKDNPNIEKLYGAPHIYLFDETVVSAEDINWPQLRGSLDSATMKWVKEYAAQHVEDSSMAEVLGNIAGQDYVDEYQKRVITQELSKMLVDAEFYNSDVFTQTDEYMMSLQVLSRSWTEAEYIAYHKHALAANMPGVFKDVDSWANDRTTDMLADMKAAGIDKAWIGLNSWQQAYIKPELVQQAEQQGWLIGPYDSYHSVHEPGKEQWLTASFPEEVYNEMAIRNKQGEYIAGFQSVGRKVNPTLSLPYVRSRVSGIINSGTQFNSWFVDCDATGEIYDDYSPEHSSSRQQDYDARLERMKTIAEEYKMVVGSEGGNDYAANSIAFAHGIELQSFSWMDEDMNKNKESEYYMGRWYAPDGGAPEKFTLPVPVKDKYKQIFLNSKYNVPLYKIVYNNAIVTAYHWDWSTLKIKGEEDMRMLYEMLYNVPPMYHLDKFQWEQNKDAITEHVREWSDWSEGVINEEVTGFEVLTDDGMVQRMDYGEIAIIANFGDSAYQFDGKTVESMGYVIVE